MADGGADVVVTVTEEADPAMASTWDEGHVVAAEVVETVTAGGTIRDGVEVMGGGGKAGTRLGRLS